MGNHFTSYQNIFKILHVICPFLACNLYSLVCSFL
uniref:Uncharacterized protein n=1 Tax=Arundo donax TaxID=35708 RepID=A0A0A9GJK5_ARUDO